jgi:hypothetical protein
MNRKRKAQSSFLSFMLYLVLGIVFAIFFFYVLLPYLKNDQSKASFVEFYNKVVQIDGGQSGATDYHILELSKGGGVVVYNEGVDEFKVKWALSFKKSPNPFGADPRLVFKRPVFCAEDHACFCYYNKINFEKKGTEWVMIPSDKISCKIFDQPLYLNFIDCNKKLDIDNECLRNVDDKRMNEGFAIMYNIKTIQMLNIKEFASNLKQRPVYIEKYGNVLSISLYNPVLSPTDKKIIDFRYDLRGKLDRLAKDYYADDPTALAGNVLFDEGDAKKDWKLEFETKDAEVEADGKKETKKQTQVKFTNDKLDPKVEESYLIDFPEIQFIKMVGANPDPISKKSPSKVQVYYKETADTTLTIKDVGGIIGGIMNKEYALDSINTDQAFTYGPFPEGGEPKPPFALAFYYKEK